MKKRWVLIFVIVACAAVFAFSGWKLLELQLEYKSGEDTYTGLEEYISIPTPTAPVTDSTSTPDQTDEVTEEDTTIWPVVDFDALREVNSDIVAWIYLEDTTINYPVVQGDDNSYYLNHMFEGSWNSAGCIFLDSRNEENFSNRHSIIYGHHMKNDTMFSDLDYYKKQEFYDEHPVILLMTPDRNYKIEVFAGYVTDVSEDAWELNFTDTQYAEWLTAAKEKSCFVSHVSPQVEDRVVTLSTCSYEFDGARFDVVGVLV